MLRVNGKVVCLSSTYGSITVGQQYPILAVEGDEDFVCGGTVIENGFITTDDSGDNIYVVFPSSQDIAWAVVEDK